MDAQQIAVNIIKILQRETRFSGLDFYPVDIKDIQNEIGVDDVAMNTALKLVTNQGLVRYRALDNSMIELTKRL